MKYFTLTEKENWSSIHFFNRGWSIYSTVNKPNLLDELNITPKKFVDKANELFDKYQIVIPKDYPKHSIIGKKLNGKIVDDFPVYDFLICIYCCIVIEEEFGTETSKILRWELIKPNCISSIHHACSMVTITLYYLKQNFIVSIPKGKKKGLNPDLTINDLKCEVKTIQEADWEWDVDPETGFGKRKTKGPDLCYDLGTFIRKENSGYKGIRQGDMVFVDLTLKSLGDTLSTIRGLGYRDLIEYGLPDPKKYRIIFFTLFKLEIVGYYIDFEPRLWNLIDIVSGIEYQKARFSFSIAADGKFHKVNIPPPPPTNEEN